MPNRITFSDELGPAEAFFNAIHDSGFVRSVRSLAWRRDLGFEATSCGFPENIEPDEEPFEGVQFWVFDEHVTVSAATFRDLLEQTIEAQRRRKPEQADALDVVLAELRAAWPAAPTVVEPLPSPPTLHTPEALLLAFFAGLPDWAFPRMAAGLLDGVGVGGRDVACEFPRGRAPWDAPFEGVKISALGEQAIVSDAELRHALLAAGQAFTIRKPDQAKRLDAVLARLDPSS